MSRTGFYYSVRHCSGKLRGVYNGGAVAGLGGENNLTQGNSEEFRDIDCNDETGVVSDFD